MKIIYTRPDGGVSIVNSASKADLERTLGTLTDEEYEAHIWSRSVPVNAIDAQKIADDFELPDREFRNAWRQVEGTIEHDLFKARDIQLERVRLARAPKLAELDKEFMLAIEQDDTAKRDSVIAAKTALRDITEPLKALTPQSIDDVKKAFPESLKQERVNG